MAGAAVAELDATSVAELLDAACSAFGARFAALLSTSAIWVNGEPATGERAIGPGDEVAVLPPVSGGQ